MLWQTTGHLVILTWKGVSRAHLYHVAWTHETAGGFHPPREQSQTCGQWERRRKYVMPCPEGNDGGAEEVSRHYSLVPSAAACRAPSPPLDAASISLSVVCPILQRQAPASLEESISPPPARAGHVARRVRLWTWSPGPPSPLAPVHLTGRLISCRLYCLTPTRNHCQSPGCSLRPASTFQSFSASLKPRFNWTIPPGLNLL